MSLSAAVVFGGATLAFALVSEHMWNNARETVLHEPWEYEESDKSTIRAFHIAGYASLGLGVVGLISAAILAPFVQWKKPTDEVATELSLSVWSGPQRGGLVLKGRF